MFAATFRSWFWIIIAAHWWGMLFWILRFVRTIEEYRFNSIRFDSFSERFSVLVIRQNTILVKQSSRNVIILFVRISLYSVIWYIPIHFYSQLRLCFLFRIFVKVILEFITLLFIPSITLKIWLLLLSMPFIQLRRMLSLNILLLSLFLLVFGWRYSFNFSTIDFFIQVIMFD